MTRSDLLLRALPDGSYLLTARAPKDCVGRETSAYVLHYPMTKDDVIKLRDSITEILGW